MEIIKINNLKKFNLYNKQIQFKRNMFDILKQHLYIFFYFIYQYIYPGWAGYKNCILPQRPAENNVQEKIV